MWGEGTFSFNVELNDSLCLPVSACLRAQNPTLRSPGIIGIVKLLYWSLVKLKPALRIIKSWQGSGGAIKGSGVCFACS